MAKKTKQPLVVPTNEQQDASIDKMNKEINDSGIAVHNKYLGGKRIIIEHIYYRWRTMFFRSKLKI